MNQILSNLCSCILLFIRCTTALDLTSEKAFENSVTVSTSPVPEEIFCPAENVTTRDYGTFHFPEIKASRTGVEVKASCPLGFAEDGMEPIESLFAKKYYISKDIRLQESGAHRRCMIEQRDTNDTPVGKWVPPVNQLIVNHCRTINAVSAAEAAKADAMTITALTFRQTLAKFSMLQMFASLGDFSCAKTLVDSISHVLGNLGLFENNDLNEEKKGLFLLLDTYSKEVSLPPGYRIKVENPQLAIETAQFIYTTANVNNGQISIVDYTMEIGNVKLNLPAEAIQMSLGQSSSEEGPKLKFTAYGEDLFFHWQTDIASTTTTTTTLEAKEDIVGFSNTSEKDTAAKDVIGNWRVYSVELIDASITNLTKEFEYIIYVEKNTEDYTWECVYWDEETEAWSTEGMNTYRMENAIICKSTHLTAFSLLIDPLPSFPGSDYDPIQNTIHSNILAILSSLGSAFSIVGLVGTCLTYGLFRVLRKERANRLLLCLSASLLCLHLLSITSEKYLWDNQCFVPAALLHYFLHASLWWMLMEAYHMHQLLISVFVKPESHFLLKRALFAWGIPLVIVSVCAVIQPAVYTTGRNDMCIIAAHLNLPLYYAAYLTPAVIILVINFFVFCRIFNVLYKQTVRQTKEKRRAKQASESKGQNTERNWNNQTGKKSGDRITYVMLSPTQIKGAMTVMILVGVGWIVGLAAIGPFEVFFKYLFCICNAGQGAMIFLFRVILHPKACQQWKKTILGFTVESGNELSTTSSTNVSNNRKLGIITPTFISASNSVENSLTPSNPATQDYAKTLASMMKTTDNQANSRTNY